MTREQQLEKVEKTLLALGNLVSTALSDVAQLKQTVPSSSKRREVKRQTDLIERVITGQYKKKKVFK